MDFIFLRLDELIDLLWLVLGFPSLIALGIYFTYRSRAIQIRKIPTFFRSFLGYLRAKEGDQHARGAPPLQMFFASIGGCIGIGNVVGICTAVQIGGPGAVFWVWVTAFFGMLVKYVEVFLGMRYRQKNQQGGYDGGPSYYLQQAFSAKWVPALAALLLCIYGVEVYIFRVVVDTFVLNWEMSRPITVLLLLVAVLYGVGGGLRRVGKIAEWIVPICVLAFLVACLVVLLQNITLLPEILATVFHSAFHGHAAVGGFVGSTAMLAVSQGISWGCYTGDIGIGYASVIHSESSETSASKQAGLAVIGIFIDTLLVCSLSLAVILITGVWNEPLSATLLVQTALAEYIPGVGIFLPILFGMLGYSTLIAFFGVGMKSARFLGGEIGARVYWVYGTCALLLFSYFDPEYAAILMRATGCLLLFLNVVAFFRLRKEITFS